MSFITKTIAWLKGAVKTVEHAIQTGAEYAKVDVAPIIVAITGGINTALSSGIVGSITGVVESILPSLGHLPEQLVTEARKWSPKILAAALAIEGLPDSPTPQDTVAFEKRVMDAFDVHPDPSKVFTVFAADMLNIIQKYSEDTTPKTFAQRVILIESIFQAYKSDVIDAKKTPIAVTTGVAQ